MPKRARTQGGAAMIEFALTFALFWLVFIGLIELSRVMLAWNAAADAVQAAARVESIKKDSAQANDKVKAMLAASGQMSADWEVKPVYYDAAGAQTTECAEAVLVELPLENANLTTLIPLDALKTISLSPDRFRTTVLRESMECSP